jgi:hypothetical protein
MGPAARREKFETDNLYCFYMHECNRHFEACVDAGRPKNLLQHLKEHAVILSRSSAVV